jgi:hypothetical protein
MSFVTFLANNLIVYTKERLVRRTPVKAIIEIPGKPSNIVCTNFTLENNYFKIAEAETSAYEASFKENQTQS